MTLNSSLLHNSITSSNAHSINSTSASDLSTNASRYSTSILGNSGNRHSPLTDVLPGPSGIGPVQQAPLVSKSIY